MATLLHPRGPDRLKLTAILLLLVPTVILAAFAIGETAGGDISGLQHVPEALLLIALLVMAWRRPRVTGGVLLIVGAVLFVAWLVFALQNLSPPALAVTALLIFAPPIVAGWLLYRAGRVAR